MFDSQLTRRDFLKLISAGTLALALKDLKIVQALTKNPVSQGCMTISGIPLYDAPSFNAKKIHRFGKDNIVNVTGIEENGDFGNDFNSAWYQIDGEGYTYSGWVLPVKTEYQKPNFHLNEKGQLGEITIPFVDTKLDPYVYAKRGYRLYYQSTHWVKRVVVTREEKSIWYQIYDSQVQKDFFVPSHAMRLVPDEELTPLASDVPNEAKSIVIDLTAQLVTAFEGDALIFSQRCSSGAEGTETPKGEFRTYHKGASVHMTNQGDALENIYDLPGVPWSSFFTGNGDAFHGTYWHNDYGRPRSHGCINLPSDAAKFLYRWTSPNVSPEIEYLNLPGEGTRVQIF